MHIVCGCFSIVNKDGVFVFFIVVVFMIVWVKEFVICFVYDCVISCWSFMYELVYFIGKVVGNYGVFVFIVEVNDFFIVYEKFVKFFL